MNYKSFSLGDWIGHISGVIEDETTLDGNEMRDLVEFLSTLKQEPCEDAVSRKEMLDYQEYLHGKMSNEENYKLWEFIKALPSVTSAQKKSERAHWIDNHNGTISCSCCHAWFHKDDRYSYMRYCPNCDAEIGGRRMTREEAIAQLKMDRDLCSFNPMTGEEEPMNEDCRKSAEALNIAINALERLIE